MTPNRVKEADLRLVSLETSHRCCSPCLFACLSVVVVVAVAVVAAAAVVDYLYHKTDSDPKAFLLVYDTGMIESENSPLLLPLNSTGMDLMLLET